MADTVPGSRFSWIVSWYAYLVVMAWIVLDALIGSHAPLLAPFQGRHLLSALIVATLPLMIVTPLGPAFRRMPALPLLFVFLLWVSFGFVRSPLSSKQFLTLWLVDLCFGAVAVLVIHYATTTARLHGWIDATLAQATFIAAYGIYGWFATTQGVHDHQIPSLYRTGSSLGQPLPLAVFLTTIFPFALYRTVTARRAVTRAAGCACMLIVLVATALTFSRGPAIAFTLGSIVALCFAPSLTRRVAFLAGPALLWAIQLAIGSRLALSALQRFESRDVATLNSRTVLWQSLLDHVDPGRLLGEGLGAAGVLLKRLRVTGEGGRLIGTTPHNLFLGTVYEHGVIGLTLLVIVFGAVLWGLLRTSSSESADRRFLKAAALGSFVSLLITNLLHDAFWMQSIGLYVWLTLALPFARCWDADGRLPDHPKRAVGIGPLQRDASG